MGKKTKTHLYFLWMAGAATLLLSFAMFGFTPKKTGQMPPTQPKSEAETSVWITKLDGSQSCSPESGESLDKGAEELKQAHIPVLNSKKGSDGKMHIEMCGAPKGTTNMYLIPRDQLPSAQQLGFKEGMNPLNQIN